MEDNENSLIERRPLTIIGASGGLFYGLLVGFWVVGASDPLAMIGCLLVGTAFASGLGEWLDSPR